MLFLQLPIPPGIGGSTLKNKKTILTTTNATKCSSCQSVSTLTVEPIPKASNMMEYSFFRGRQMYLYYNLHLFVIIERKRGSTDKF